MEVGLINQGSQDRSAENIDVRVYLIFKLRTGDINFQCRNYLLDSSKHF